MTNRACDSWSEKAGILNTNRPGIKSEGRILNPKVSFENPFRSWYVLSHSHFMRLNASAHLIVDERNVQKKSEHLTSKKVDWLLKRLGLSYRMPHSYQNYVYLLCISPCLQGVSRQTALPRVSLRRS